MDIFQRPKKKKKEESEMTMRQSQGKLQQHFERNTCRRFVYYFTLGLDDLMNYASMVHV